MECWYLRFFAGMIDKQLLVSPKTKKASGRTVSRTLSTEDMRLANSIRNTFAIVGAVRKKSGFYF